jgi:hypothetical protein
MEEIEVTQEELYKMEIREMQKEINYLRHRVTKLTDELYDLKEHTKNSVGYLQDTINDLF